MRDSPAKVQAVATSSAAGGCAQRYSGCHNAPPADNRIHGAAKSKEAENEMRYAQANLLSRTRGIAPDWLSAPAVHEGPDFHVGSAECRVPGSRQTHHQTDGAMASFERAIKTSNANSDAGFPFMAFESESETSVRQTCWSEILLNGILLSSAPLRPVLFRWQ